jgi:Delta3-Delta2-enoyl-CoA isomerase
MDGGENLFNQRWLDAFSGVLDRIEAAAGPAALVTTGEQKFYSNGIDIDWLATIPAEAGGFLAEVNRLFARLLGFRMATVAAINGHAFGAGAVLAVAHDVIVMREDRGYWCLPEADLGFPITPAMQPSSPRRCPGDPRKRPFSPAAATGGPRPRRRGSCTRWPARTRCSHGLSSWPPSWPPRTAGQSPSTNACCTARRSRRSAGKHEQVRARA